MAVDFSQVTSLMIPVPAGTQNLPYDAEIEYLEAVKNTSAPAYIDTGISIDYTKTATIEARVAFYDTGATQVMGCNNSLYIRRNKDGKMHLTDTTLTVGEWHTLKAELANVSSGTYNYYLDGQFAATATATNTQPYKVGVFCVFNTTPAAVSSALCSARIAWYKVTVAGVVVRDLIPVRRGQVGYLYDKISGGLFGTGGAGAFLLGTDKAVTRYPVKGISIGGVAVWKNPTLPPYDAKVEYIESTTDTQGIHTGIFSTSGPPSLVLDGQFRSYTSTTGNTLAYFGRHNSPTLAVGVSSSGYFRLSVGRTTPNNSTIERDLNRHVFFVDGPSHTYGIDGQVRGDPNITVTSWNSTAEIFLFNKSGANFPLFRLYGCTISDNGTVIRDYIPVRVGTTGCVYDKRGIGGINADGTARDDGLYFSPSTDPYIVGPDIN